MINVNVSSDVAPLREVVVGPFKRFSRLQLVLDSRPDLAGLRQLRHNRVEIPHFERAASQHRRFVEQLRAHAVTVHEVDPVESVTIQLYPRDIGVVIDSVFYLTRPRLPIRRKEQHGLVSILPLISTVKSIESGRIEGGDVIVDDDAVLVGLGEETDRDGIEALRVALRAQGSERHVIPVEFSHRGIVHLDTKFTLVAPGIGVYQPEAFTFASRAELERRYDLIAATEREARCLDLNTLVLGRGTVMVNATADRLAAALQDRGVTPVLVDYDEVTRFPGGLRCATLPLIRG